MLLSIFMGSGRRPATYLVFFGALFMFFLNFLVGLIFVLDLKNFFAYFFIFFFKKAFLVFFSLLF